MTSNGSPSLPMSPGIESNCTLVLSRRQILDTLIVAKTPEKPQGRPAYATTTDGTITTLSRIDGRGRMSEVSRILWPSGSSSHQLLINGQLMLVNNVLQRSKSLFGSHSRTFAAGTMRCKWKSGTTGTLHTGPLADRQQVVTGSVYTSLQVWTCYDTTNDSARATAHGSSSSSRPVVALFFPPQPGFIKSELTIYPNGEPIIDHIVLTSLLLCTRKDEWRSSQSSVTPAALEASLRADLRGSLPPYLATAPVRPRVTSPSQRRRPHTATSPRIRRPSSQGLTSPPPYASVDDIALRLR